jgi:hypothetical protein
MSVMGEDEDTLVGHGSGVEVRSRGQRIIFAGGNYIPCRHAAQVWV